MISVREAFALAFAHEAAGRFDRARGIYADILATIPEHPGALFKLAEAEQRNGRLDEAGELLERAVRAAPAQGLPTGDLWMALGRLHVARKAYAGAESAFAQAQATGHTGPEPARMLAWLALERGEAQEGLARARAGLHAFPHDAELLHLRGKALFAGGALGEACAALEDALAASQGDPGIRVTLAAVCIESGRAREAHDQLRRAIEAGEDSATTWDNLGLACLRLGDLHAAVRAFERAVGLDPKLTPALSNLVDTLRHACRFAEAEARECEWLAALEQPGRDPRWNPFVALTLGTTPAQQLALSRRWSRRALPPVPAPALVAARGTRLRVGYLSSDFREHPMSMLIAGHFERHDRARFDVFGYSHGADDGSAMRKRVAAAFPHWIEACAMSDAELAQRIRADGIDVLIDLNGHTQGHRLAVLARRPAPVQLHYLGFPGTLGFDGIDGIIADAIVVPPGEERHFHERVWRLPRCYFVNDHDRALPSASSRAALGFSDDALVLVSFNQAYKLTRSYFQLWLEVLAHVPRALLWLYIPAPVAQENIVAEARRWGIDPQRIRFASKVSPIEHLARLRAADLSLDVAPYNSHTTGCDSLWAGVPLLTCRGTTFAGRVGESLLAAAGLSELVAPSLAAYRTELLALAADRERLRHYRDHLERERYNLPLFDTDGFTRDFESLLVAAYENVNDSPALSRS